MGNPFARLLVDQQVVTHPLNPKNPQVSVVMPVHMRRPGRLTERAIESVLAQTFQDFEFIIIDDGSIDGLWKELQDYQKKDSRIVLVRHETNCGLPSARIDEGLLLAKGTYIGYMFEDDEWSSNALDLLMATMRKTAKVCLVYGAVEWMDSSLGSNSVVLSQEAGNATNEREYQSLGEWDFSFADLMADNRIANCGVLHPLSMLRECGLYDPHVLMRRLSDHDLWIRLARVFPFERCRDVVARVSPPTKHSLGRTVDHDPVLTRRYMAQERDVRLTPERIQEFELDSLAFIADPDEEYRIREHYVVPYLSQRADILAPGATKVALANSPSSNRLLITKPDYSTSVDVTLGNYQHILSNSIQSSVFIPERNLHIAATNQFDSLILYRTIGKSSLRMAEQAVKDATTVIYLMDDNMFKFGRGYLEDEFSYLKPDTVGYETLQRLVMSSDLVLSYSRQITADCIGLNPRTVELSTSIQDAYVRNALPLPGGHSTERRLKYAILTGSARKREIRTLWSTFQEFSHSHKDGVEFHLWGFDTSNLGNLACPTYYRPFDHSYTSYMRALQEERFDYLICPLFDDHDTKKSKSPVKYLEATAAGAVGIFSDVTAYEEAKAGQTCLKVVDEPLGWHDALEASFALSDGHRQSLFENAQTHILERFTSESQVLGYLSALEAARLHRQLRSRSSSTGRAAIAYFFNEPLLGGATIHLMKHAVIAKDYRFNPILCFPRGTKIGAPIHEFAGHHNLQIAQLAYSPTVWRRGLTPGDSNRARHLSAWLEANDIRLIHQVTYSADVISAANSLEIPAIVTLHQHYVTPKALSDSGDSQLANPVVAAVHSSSLENARRWGDALDAAAFCIRSPVNAEYFAAFEKNLPRILPDAPTLLVSGTIQPRKGQLEAIEAVGILNQQGIEVQLTLLGYDHLVPDYVAECKRRIRKLALEEIVTLAGFSSEPMSSYAHADFILCASTDESMPQSVLQAMAAGVRVITTPVGGVEELIQDGFTGIVAEGITALDIAQSIARALEIPHNQWQAMLRKAKSRADMVSEREVVAYKLLRLYNYGVDRSTRLGVGRGRRGSEFVNRARRKSKMPEPLHVAEPSSSESLVSNPVVARRITARGLSYIVGSDRSRWNGLRVIFATYGKSLSGSLTIRVYNAWATESPLREINFDLGRVKDNAEHLIEFPPIIDSLGQGYLVVFKPHLARPGLRLAIYEEGELPGLPRRLLQRISKQGGVLHVHPTFATS